VRITTEEKGNVLVVRPQGELDFFSADELRQILRQECDAGRRALLLDPGEIRYIDSSGLGLLIEIQHTFNTAGGRMALASIVPDVVNIFRNTSLIRFFDVHPDELAALAALEE